MGGQRVVLAEVKKTKKRQGIALKSVRKQINVSLRAPLPVIPKLWLH